MADDDTPAVAADEPGAAVDAAAGAEVSYEAAPSPVMEKAVAAGSLLLGLAMLVGARSIHVRAETGGLDPRAWPTGIAIGVLVAAGWVTFNALTHRRGERDVDRSTRRGWAQVAITVALTALVLVLWQLGLSFLLLGGLYLVALNWVYGLRTWRSLLLFPAVIVVILYVVFMLVLGVRL